MRKNKWLVLLGSVLIFCGLGLMLFSQIRTCIAKDSTAELLIRLEEILPSKTVGVIDSYSSMEMPTLEFEGKNIVAVLNFPELGRSLPIESTWNKNRLTSLPQRFSGSVYDSSLIIGGSDQQGQFDCLKKLDIGYTVTVTDMTGAEYTYTVIRIERKKSADAEILTDEASDLTLFVREAYSTEYITVRCANKV